MLADWYLWIKAGHIMAVIAWMAGIFYLPRLFVYHAERRGEIGGEPGASFTIMESKLLRLIMRPAMLATWGFGILLASIPGVIGFDMLWVWMKLFGILAMTAFHGWLAWQQKLFEAGRNRTSGRTFRLMNEVPTLLMVLIVISVVVKP